MGQQGKILITEDGPFDLSEYQWDDHRFSDMLIKQNPIDSDQALSISRFLREEIAKMNNGTITMSTIEKLIGAKMDEYGHRPHSPVSLDKSIFIKNGLKLSPNAKTVLERRYLK